MSDFDFDSSIRLQAVIYAQNRLVLWHDGRPEPCLPNSLTLAPSRPLGPVELLPAYASSMIKNTDVPRTFSPNLIDPSLQTWYQAQSGDLGQVVQYLFSDGLCLTANQLLRHRHSLLVPRPLWPVLLNIPTELRSEYAFHLQSGREHAYRSSWYLEAEKTLFGVLLNASRLRMRDGFQLFFTQNEATDTERRAIEVNSIRLSSAINGGWVLRTHPDMGRTGETGRARLSFEFQDGEEEILRTQNFTLALESRLLSFHSLWAQTTQIEEMISPLASRAKVPGSTTVGKMPVIELGGHAQIQASVSEIDTALTAAGSKPVAVLPARLTVPASGVVPRLQISHDGALRINTHVNTSWGAYEVAGLPSASSYILTGLTDGLGATTGIGNSQIAYKRRGIKRDRDMKILKHLGFAALIFFDAANFALGRPLSDGSRVNSESDLLRSLFSRLGSLLLKAEGWPVQTGSLETLCSSNVTSLITGFVRQVIRDCEETKSCLYLPEGEVALEGLPRKIVAFFRALVSDLAQATTGSVFERARTRYFQDFMITAKAATAAATNNGTAPIAATAATAATVATGVGEDDDGTEFPEVIAFNALSANPSAQAFAASERAPVHLLPESSRPPRGSSLLSLSEQGFVIFYEGQTIETFGIQDFRSEFNLNETAPDDTPLITNDTRNIDWFELHPKFFFKGVEISSEQASRLSREGLFEYQGKLYRLRPEDMPSLNRLQSFWDRIQSGPSALSGAKRRPTHETYYRLPKSQTLELLALRASGVKISGGERWQKICDFYDQMDTQREAPPLPASFRADLKGYQKIGVRWLKDLFDLGLGGILADDMGLGKTVTTLALLELLRSQNNMGQCVIVVPTSLTFNWLSECERFAPEIPVRVFQSRAQEELLDFLKTTPQGMVITTYGLLQENSGWFGQTPWNIVIFDEAQNLKNISAKRTTAARLLQGSFKICLTGTPLENHYGEFYSIFDLVLPGALGELSEFREKYVNPAALLREDIQYLRAKTRPLVLRRTKSQVMQELPPKIETTVKLPFEPEQKRIYRDIAASYNEQIRTTIRTQGESKTQLQMLTALLRLRQACSDPASIPNVRYSGEPPKLSVLLEALEEVTEAGESALIFTQFLATFHRIKRALENAGIRAYDISGADPRSIREKRLKSFCDEPGGAVMLMTLKTGGVGLNLTKASYVFHVEPWWNPAVENQATDRAHRIGQQKTVQVYRYIIRESVEEKIELLKDIKGQRFDALFTQTENETELGTGRGHLTQSDFEYLLS